MPSFFARIRARGGFTLPVLTTDATPASGEVAIYAKSDGNIYKKNSSGTETAIAASAGLSAYPVGAIYMSVVNTSPATLFGGTWAVWGTGRVPVGIDTGQTEFDTVEETGGAKTVTLTAKQLPKHAHDDPMGASGGAAGTADRPLRSSGTPDGGFRTGNGIYVNSAYGAAEVGTQDPTSILQPYITCYMWKRTA